MPILRKESSADMAPDMQLQVQVEVAYMISTFAASETPPCVRFLATMLYHVIQRQKVEHWVSGASGSGSASGSGT